MKSKGAAPEADELQLNMISVPLPEVEDFLDADEAAKYCHLDREVLLRKARVGLIPGHPQGSGKRKTWLFLKSELFLYLKGSVFSASGTSAAQRRAA